MRAAQAVAALFSTEVQRPTSQLNNNIIIPLVVC